MASHWLGNHFRAEAEDMPTRIWKPPGWGVCWAGSGYGFQHPEQHHRGMPDIGQDTATVVTVATAATALFHKDDSSGHHMCKTTHSPCFSEYVDIPFRSIQYDMDWECMGYVIHIDIPLAIHVHLTALVLAGHFMFLLLYNFHGVSRRYSWIFLVDGFNFQGFTPNFSQNWKTQQKHSKT